jgi:N-methylhydantoinase B/oxoprolinase/acetone carboxylase alpha subunit
MPPTSDGVMIPRITSEVAMFHGREEGNQNWCSRRALHVDIGGLVTGSHSS